MIVFFPEISVQKMPPPGLHSLILYDNFEWKTAQKSHENLQTICVLTKIPAVSLEEFETKFYGILKENYQRKLDFRNLAEIDNLKLCIISDVLAGKSIGKSYKDMLETFGADNIDMSDLKKQLVLRRVSNSLKTVVEQGNLFTKELSIDFQQNFICVDDIHFSASYSAEWDVDYEEMPLKYAMMILKNTKLQLNRLHIVSSSSTDPVFIDFLKNLSHKISTKELYLNVDCPETTHLFLTCMKPEFLDILTLKTGNIDEIVKLDYFLDFPVFSIKLSNLTEEHLMNLREGLSKSQKFKDCYISTENPIRLELIENVFSLSSGPEFSGNIKIQYSYTIPNSENTLKIIVYLGFVSFEIHRSS
ncbi:hypothetical protein B9Z55_021101 [Caenorhabditis nigoni]|uniref:DUF38 domain-containing protein n=2 Tax=Caenorhabditis nigoni TaxID=1611254 RepID=A0A2G5TQH7_9PELO|nr:hypothetical protein B9Z55_021101 [Caenorhabditis nigoni]